MDVYYPPTRTQIYRNLLYSAQNIVKKDPGRARQNSLDSLTLNILGSAVSNFIGISDGCISIEETKELA